MNNLDIKKMLCEGFCSGITVSKSGNMFSISAPFEVEGGDPVNFYLVPMENNRYRIEDDGSFVPTLIASGVNVMEGTRNQEFTRILDASGISYDSSSGELVSKNVAIGDIADTTLRYINAVLKIDALKAPLRPEGVASMFKQDVKARLERDLAGKATIVYDEPLAEKLSDFQPDAVVRPQTGKTAAIYMLTNDQRAWEAIALRYKAIKEEQIECSVIGVFDKVGSRLVSKRSIASVSHHLDAATYFYDGQEATMARIVEELGLNSPRMH